MMDFELIWPRFSWVLDDMRNGMAFFEGYIPVLAAPDLRAPLLHLIERAENHSFKTSTWGSNTSESDWDKEYSVAEYAAFFQFGRIYTLHFDYEVLTGNTPLFLRLLFDRDLRYADAEREVALEIICYRDTILESPEPKQALANAISEFGYLKQLFQGDALMLGPDTLDVPKSATEFSREWLRIE